MANTASNEGVGESLCVDNAMMKVLAKAFVPLVRLCLRNGVTFTAASQLLKRIFIKVAYEEEVRSESKSSANLSRIALKTAINRTDVKQTIDEALVETIDIDELRIESRVLDIGTATKST